MAEIYESLLFRVVFYGFGLAGLFGDLVCWLPLVGSLKANDRQEWLELGRPEAFSWHPQLPARFMLASRVLSRDWRSRVSTETRNVARWARFIFPGAVVAQCIAACSLVAMFAYGALEIVMLFFEVFLLS